MNIIIAGATGMIGTSLVKFLLAKNYNITVISRNAQSALNMFDNKINAITWNVTTQQLATILTQQDALINLSGENVGKGRWTKERKEKIISSRISGIEKLSTAMALALKKPKVVLQASAIGFYGNTGQTEVTETTEAGKGFLADVCIKWEKAASSLNQPGVRTVILRTGVVLSPEDGALKQFLLPFRLFVGGPIGSGEQYISWIHLEDQIQAMYFLLQESKAEGVYNLTAPAPVSMSHFTNILGKLLHRPSWLPLPSAALKILMGQMAEEMVLSGSKVLPNRLQAEGFQFKFPDLETALTNLVLK